VVEFAIVFLLFMTLVWGIITYGVVFAVQQTVTHAAGEAARATVSQPTVEEAEAVALSVAASQTTWLGEHVTTSVEFLPCDAANPDGATCVHVEFTYPWAEHPIVTPLFSVGIPDVLRGDAVAVWEGF
jgi:Flp pilus assembly protein TadG